MPPAFEGRSCVLEDEWPGILGVVTGRNQQVRDDRQLVVGELDFVVAPVVMVSSSKVRQSLLDGGRDGWWFIEVVTQKDEDLGHKGWHVVGERVNARAQTQDARMTLDQVAWLQWSSCPTSGPLRPLLVHALGLEHRQEPIADLEELTVKQASKGLTRCLPHLQALILEQGQCVPYDGVPPLRAALHGEQVGEHQELQQVAAGCP